MTETRSRCRQQTEENRIFGGYWMEMNEDDARALARGEVTERVREMARCLCDWDFNLLQQTREREAEREKQAIKPAGRKRKGQAA